MRQLVAAVRSNIHAGTSNLRSDAQDRTSLQRKTSASSVLVEQLHESWIGRVAQRMAKEIKKLAPYRTGPVGVPSLSCTTPKGPAFPRSGLTRPRRPSPEPCTEPPPDRFVTD